LENKTRLADAAVAQNNHLRRPTRKTVAMHLGSLKSLIGVAVGRQTER
jgi:hypothetical protein